MHKKSARKYTNISNVDCHRDDIERAAKKLKILGSGFQVITLGSQKMVQSVPCELNTDHTTVLVVAQVSFLAKKINF